MDSRSSIGHSRVNLKRFDGSLGRARRAAGIAASVLFLRRLRTSSASERAGIRMITFPVLFAMLVPIFALNIHNVVARGSFGPFLAGVIFLLAYSSFLFARMLISSFARRAA